MSRFLLTVLARVVPRPSAQTHNKRPALRTCYIVSIMALKQVAGSSANDRKRMVALPFSQAQVRPW